MESWPGGRFQAVGFLFQGEEARDTDKSQQLQMLALMLIPWLSGTTILLVAIKAGHLFAEDLT